MMAHPHDDIEAFALGELDATRAAQVLAHADACPTCAVLLADAMNGVAALAELEETREMKRPLARLGAAESRLGAAELIRPTAARRPNVAAWLAGAAAAACLALLFWNIQLRNDALGVPVDALVHSHFIHHPLHSARSTGAAKVLQSLDGRWLYVVADGLMPRAHYDLWETRAGTTLMVGEFSADGAGRTAKYFEQQPGAIDALAVTETGRSPSQDANALRWP
jgi:hypothetical protein